MATYAPRPLDDRILDVLVSHVSFDEGERPSKKMSPYHPLLDDPQVLFDLTDVYFWKTLVLFFDYFKLRLRRFHHLLDVDIPNP